MAYRIEKETGDLVIDGFEKGIAASPHAGIANIQNGNISTEMGEVTASFLRSQQTLQSSATGTGNLTYLSTDHVNLDINGSNDRFKGSWITVTNSNHLGELPNGVYYVPASTGAGFKLANYYNVSATTGAAQNAQVLVIAGGGGGGSYTGSGSGGAGGGGAGGFTYNAAVPISQGVNLVSVGDGGAGGVATTGSNGGGSSFASVVSAGGGGGASTATNSGGVAGGSGGGAGGSGTATGGAGTVSQGNKGGDTVGSTGAGAGGGGATAAATNVSGNNGSDGGAGTANSNSGASVTYSGGGGGGAFTGGTQGNGGAGGGGAGGASGNGVAGTANTGGGGGGGSREASGTGQTGGKGGSGIVIISFPTGVVTNTATAGGTHTVSGGRDIFTFSTVGNFVFAPTYANTAAPAANLSGFTAGLTANFTVLRLMGKPLAKATETYSSSGTTYYRYYILDNQNLVWVYDSINDTLYSSSDNVSWFLPDYSISWCTSASGIAVIDGFLIATAQSGTYGKPVVNLGGTNTQTTTWAEFATDIPWNGGASASPHFCYVGHQGRAYITDGSYLREIFPDSTLSQTVSGTSASSTSDNVQSLSSWVPNTARNLGGFYTYATPTAIAGALPFTSDEGYLPVIFFSNGTLPSSITANRVYYVKRSANDFEVLADPNMTAAGVTVVMTGSPLAGATTAALNASWTHPTGYYLAEFTYAGGTETYNVLFTNGSASIAWATPLVNNTNTTNLHVEGILDLSTGAVGTQYFSTFYPTASAGAQDGSTPLYVLTPQRLTLPNFEVAQNMAEIGNTIIVGCHSNIVYPWDQASNLPGTIISLPESNVQSMLTVNQTCYMFAGNQGNVYITDGSLASLAINIPDYVAGVPGSPGTYIESTYTWGDSMYLRGRVFFSLYDQSASKAGNCGGIWSFYPAQNVYLEQDTGSALRLEFMNSYATYNGYAAILIPGQQQTAQQPLFWSAWSSDITTPTYGIDYSTGGTSALAPTIIETDAIPTGTMLNKKSFEQIEYKLSSPLDAAATITGQYRKNITDTWSPLKTLRMESNRLSGVISANFEKTQWLQLRITITPITSSAATNSFGRLKELRVR